MHTSTYVYLPCLLFLDTWLPFIYLSCSVVLNTWCTYLIVAFSVFLETRCTYVNLTCSCLSDTKYISLFNLFRDSRHQMYISAFILFSGSRYQKQKHNWVILTRYTVRMGVEIQYLTSPSKYFNYIAEVLLMEKSGIPKDNHRPAESNRQTVSHTVVSSVTRHEWDSNSQYRHIGYRHWMHGNFQSSYNTIMTITAHQ